MNKYEQIKQKKYSLLFYTNNKLSKIIENLSFDEAYKISIPDEALAIYPENHWHIKLKSAVLKEISKEMLNDVISISIAYFENPHSNIKNEEIFLSNYNI